MKKIIINADDFGYSQDNNEAILLGYKSGLITSCSLMANMEGFQNAVEEILPKMQNIDTGFHFNIIEGNCISRGDMLCNSNGVFNNSYIQILLKTNNKKFLFQIEQEFRAQIEKILKYTSITHIDSHVHTHAIPQLFKLTVKLAKEYNINYIRTQNEIPYIAGTKIFNHRFPLNIPKNILLNYFTNINKRILKNINLKTNNYFIGVLYTGYMDETSILEGLKRIKKTESLTEIIFHPNINKNKENNYREFLITQNPHFKDILQNAGFIPEKRTFNLN